jgi:hypothetical protein
LKQTRRTRVGKRQVGPNIHPLPLAKKSHHRYCSS